MGYSSRLTNNCLFYSKMGDREGFMRLRTLGEDFTVDQNALWLWKRIKVLEKQRRIALDKKDFNLASKLTNERQETLRKFV